MSEEKDCASRLPDFGPLEIEDWNGFLKESKVCFNERWEKPIIAHQEKLKDFTQCKRLGKGSFGNVILIKHKKTDDYFAMKSMAKSELIKRLDYVKREKMVLQSMNFPFTVYLKFFFQDNSYIYFVMPFIPGGEFNDYLEKVCKLDEVQAKFYVSQIVLALEYLHSMDIVYRDLKPENVLMDHNGYLKLTDFGLCKRLTDLNPRTYTMCGTPEFIPPEVIMMKGCGKAADWWSLGVFVFELVSGYPPFSHSDTMELYQKVLDVKYKMPRRFSSELKDLIKNLLQFDLSKRYGNLKNGVGDIKNHKWFRAIHWMAVLNRKVCATYRPKYEHPGDTGNFKADEWIAPKIARKNKFEEYFSDF